MAQQYDIIIIGGGPAGYGAALRAAELGFTVACVDNATWGGTCLHQGCIPSKFFLSKAESAQKLRSMSAFGVSTSGKLSACALQEKKNSTIQTLSQGLKALLTSKKVTLIEGYARPTDAHTIEVISGEDKHILNAQKALILATGSKPFVPKGISLGKRILTSDQLLSLTETPPKLVIVGGGYIGLELGTFWFKAGSSVTIIEGQDRLLPMFDKDIVAPLHQSLEKDGISLHLNTAMTRLEAHENSIIVHVASGESEKIFEADAVALALGRRPNIDEEIVKNLDLKREADGTLQVDPHFETSCPGVYAIGDIIKGPMLAHKAEREGYVLAEHLAGLETYVNEALIPSVIYTTPQIAAVGFNEQELNERHIPFIKAKAFFAANGRAQASGETVGFLKMLAHKETKRILGVQIVGPQAETLISEACLGLSLYARAYDFVSTIHAHPTLSEVYREAAHHIENL